MVMRKLTLMLCLVTTFFLTSFSESYFLKDMLQVIKQIESRNQADAVGDGGRAFGVIQIHEIAVKEVNRIKGTDYKHIDMFNVDVAEAFFYDYIDICTKYYTRVEKKPPTEQDLVRMYNGGYTGYKKKATLLYYQNYLKWKERIANLPLD